MATLFDHIEDFLGEKNKRFFSHGYKRTTRSISNIVITDSGAEAACQVSVPEDWSLKGNTHQAIHLSSIDALLIALQLSEAYCVVRYRLSEAQRRAMTIEYFSMKADEKPLEDLSSFRAMVGLLAVNNNTLSLTSNVGGMHIELKFQLPILLNNPHNNYVFFPNKAARYKTIDVILGKAGTNFYGGRFADATHNIKNVSVDLGLLSVTSDVDGDFPSRSGYRGMETMLKQCASPIDVMVIISQLIQCYLYLLDGISRANSSTLWMRSMTLEMSDETNQDDMSASINVLRSEKILVNNIPWRCAYVRGNFGGMTIFYSLAHALLF